MANGVTLDEVSDRIIRFYYSFFAYGKITRKNSGNRSKWKTTDVILRTRQEDVASLGIPVLPVPAGSSVGSGLLKGNIKVGASEYREGSWSRSAPDWLPFELPI